MTVTASVPASAPVPVPALLPVPSPVMLRATLLCTLLLSSPSLCLAQDEKTAPVQTIEDLHWAVRLGARVATVERAATIVDRVVLVPDAATYIDELFKWTPLGQWPVLIEDGLYAERFIRRFAPAQVVRRESVGELPRPKEARQRMAESVVISAWGGDPASQSIEQVFAHERYTPPGVVIASMDDPAWTAAVALAAGRAQPLLWLDDDHGRPDGVLPIEQGRRLARQVEHLVEALPYPWRGTGEGIETITLCRSLAGRVQENPFPERPVIVPGPHATGPVSTSDVVGRDRAGDRYAFTGWIFGGEAAGAYTAMCSLFLERRSIWLHDTYPDHGDWQAYTLQAAATVLTQGGFDVDLRRGERAGLLNWQRLAAGGVTSDLLMLNTQGMEHVFQLSDAPAWAHDVPMLETPLALHMIHSWSLRQPEDPATIGGQWLRHGVYAYVGSCQEPYLGGFVPPVMVASRLLGHVPFLVAARHWEGPVSGPWRITTIGDPLMLIPPRNGHQRERITLAAPDGTDLRERAAELMRAGDEKPSAEALREAMATLVLIGRDDIARGLWAIAEQRGQERVVARAALGPLFRARRTEDFLVAWRSIGPRDEMAIDMLWHLLTPQLAQGRVREEALLALMDTMRRPLVQVDLERLAPHLRRAFGEAYARQVIQREIERATSPDTQQALNELLRQ